MSFDLEELLHPTLTFYTFKKREVKSWNNLFHKNKTLSQFQTIEESGLQKDSNMGRSFTDLCKRGTLEEVRKALENGADVNEKKTGNWRNLPDEGSKGP